jgi:tetratricopeptide (TPR) repeat protein
MPSHFRHRFGRLTDKVALALLLAVCTVFAQTDPLDEATQLARAHRYKEAAVAIQHARPPDEAAQRIRYYRVKAAIALGNGDAPASANDMESALALAPENHDLAVATAAAQYQAADAYEQRHDSLAAVRAYERAVALAPEVEQHHLGLGLELLRHETFDAATAVFEATLRRFPNSERARVAIGICYYLAGRGDDAVNALLAAAADSALAALYLGQIELDRADPPDNAAVDRVCSFSTPHLNALCGGLLLRTGEVEAALPRLRTAAQHAPDDPAARCQLGKALDESQQFSHARIEMEACVRLDPTSPLSHYRLARLYHRLGLVELAKREERLRTRAEEKLGAENERRLKTVQGFVTEMRP